MEGEKREREPGIKKYYLIPNKNFDKLGVSEEIPEGKKELTREEAEAVLRNQLAWEQGSGYVEADIDIDAEIEKMFEKK